MIFGKFTDTCTNPPTYCCENKVQCIVLSVSKAVIFCLLVIHTDISTRCILSSLLLLRKWAIAHLVTETEVLVEMLVSVLSLIPLAMSTAPLSYTSEAKPATPSFFGSLQKHSKGPRVPALISFLFISVTTS